MLLVRQFGQKNMPVFLFFWMPRSGRNSYLSTRLISRSPHKRAIRYVPVAAFVSPRSRISNSSVFLLIAGSTSFAMGG